MNPQDFPVAGGIVPQTRIHGDGLLQIEAAEDRPCIVQQDGSPVVGEKIKLHGQGLAPSVLPCQILCVLAINPESYWTISALSMSTSYL